ncbi:MAG: asparagine synthetase B family protein [Phycisphaerales bacterium]
MCGIVLLAGPQANSRILTCVERLRHRGPDDLAVWSRSQVALGFARLEINGVGRIGRQPYVHGELVGAINGEIYNHSTLAAAHGLAACACDVHVVLPLYRRLGAQIVDEMDGFYSGVVFNASDGHVVCLRDHIGKKPLFVGRSRQEIFVTSELKALEEIEWFSPLPLGVSSVETTTGKVRHLAGHQSVPRPDDLAVLLEAAVRKRLPAVGQPFGVLLSGGLDSSLVAALVARHRADAIYFTLGDDNSKDRQAVDVMSAALGLKDVRVVPLPDRERIPELLRRVVYTTESFNPSIVSNGLATYVLAEAVRQAGMKVVLTGEGADELFGGYHMFSPSDPWREVRQQLIGDLSVTELRRLDLTSMAHGVEARCPFLDRAVRAFAEGLSFDDLYGANENKVMLRRRFEGVLPPEVLQRKKTSFDVGSGVRGEVVRYLRRNGRSEREELRDVWREQFTFDASNPYFHAYPVFDVLIDARGAGHR